MTLQVAYRPPSLDEFIGNEEAIESLKSVLDRGDVPASFLFTGPPGCGKTTLAFVIKNHLKIDDMDFRHYNTANTRGIDTIRDIIDTLNYCAAGGERKLYLLDECHQITGAAAESMLKMLEEPPKHCHFVLCTSEPEKIKPNTLRAIRRRCFELQLKPLSFDQLQQLLEEILEAEGFNPKEYPQEILDKIVANCWGSPGQALKLLDSVINMDDPEKIMKALDQLQINEGSILVICQTLTDIRINEETRWERVRKELKGLPDEPESIRYAILGYFEKALISNPPNLTLRNVTTCFIDSVMYSGRAGLYLACQMACLIGGK